MEMIPISAQIIICVNPNQKVPLGWYWVKTRMCLLVKIPVEWDINQPSGWNVRWDTAKRCYMPRKHDFEIQGFKLAQQKSRGKIWFAFSTLAEWWKWKMLCWLTMQHCVWMRTGTMWWYGGVLLTKNYPPPSGNEEYYTTAPQCKTLRSSTLCGSHISFIFLQMKSAKWIKQEWFLWLQIKKFWSKLSECHKSVACATKSLWTTKSAT